MKSTLKMVKEWHEEFDVGISEWPNVKDEELNDLRLKLLEEEIKELREALEEGDEVEALDALTDIQYILDGTYLTLGFWAVKREAFKEVHKSNMSKKDEDGMPIKRDDGKILKGPNFEPPELQKYVGMAKLRKRGEPWEMPIEQQAESFEDAEQKDQRNGRLK